ncbi:hypothetical protein SAMN05444422_11331 [Halobiforma haloterrestris]|uniref:Pyridoxamine 5'-phosphate oxidase n=1 Tax=Natronobacterium haloterrestre TaxID=148448 RepID=A0A1I1L1W0_NATHA|nr:pyridoxamine 5'-phosphate oxidase family protein [Halobiforma haloterrestris]SFC64968.1 hypothetical protein SAMN05444422_11331 [Halobiforma haloterrestris]
MVNDLLEESNTASMSEQQMRTLLEEEGIGILALPTEGVPYVVPMSFGYDGESMLYFVYLLFGTESRKESLSDDVERGRFLVYRAESVYDWQSVSLTGRIAAVPDDEWDTLRDAMQNAWHPNIFASANPMRGVRGYRFRIESWTGIQQRDGA